jgi:Holliday junction resolvasome RuvABC endonuclease subunit
MSKLSNAELAQIAAAKHLTVVNPDAYVNLDSELTFKCEKGHTFISTIEVIRNPNFVNCPICDQQVVHYSSRPPEKKGFRIIGFDQATKHFGISVFDDEKLVYYDVIDFTDEDTEVRLVKIGHFIDEVCKYWKPDFVGFEDIQLQNGAAGFKTFKVLAELFGVTSAVLQLNRIPHECVSNKVWQAMFIISGRDRAAQKANVVKKVKQLFSIDVTDDAADAVLIGKYFVNKKNHPDPATLF